MKIRGFEICSDYLSENIKLPVRKTKNSVGYDICAAKDTVIPSIWKTVFKNVKKFLSGNKDYEEIKPTLIPTGLKSYFGDDEILILANKSSYPIKKGLVMSNSIGIVESDYYNCETNEGHLQFMYYNFSFFDVTIKKGEACGQAYFQKFLKADNDFCDKKRVGGFGSTN